MDDRALVDASVANMLAAYEAVARHASWPLTGVSRSFGRAVAVVTGHPTVGFWNPVVACLPETDPDDVLAAHAWIDRQGLPSTVHLGPSDPPPALAQALEALGLHRDPWASPVMALTKIEPAPRHTELRIVPIDALTYPDWLGSFAGSIEAAERAGRTIGPAMTVDPDVQLIGGYMDDQLVATSFAVRSGSIVGVYGVGTEKAFRRRGIGTAMTRAAIDAGARWGCTEAILQSSEMGVRVYEAMGFRRIAHLVSFEPQVRSATSA
jgi:GNAT superfamily N-acetyltransferase